MECALVLALALQLAAPVLGQAGPEPGGHWAGRPLAELLQELQAEGAPLVYSSQLVSDRQLVEVEPPVGPLRQRLDAVLAGHGLEIEETSGLWLVVRSRPPEEDAAISGHLMIVLRDPEGNSIDAATRVHGQPRLPAPLGHSNGLFEYSDLEPGHYALSVTSAGFMSQVANVEVVAGHIAVAPVTLERGPAVLEELSVSASRYVIQANSQFFIDQRAIQALPDLGEDPVRSVQRLPGSAAGGLSARVHFRGGLESETAIYLNGLKLIDPFHIRDYNSIFSTIDARAISGVEAYTGGFPVTYGDQMSGVLLLESQRPEQSRRHEIGLSLYNTSLLSSGWSPDNRFEWLVTARRSNLDLMLSDDLGKPDYFDVFTELALNLDGGSRISFNALYGNDQVTVITESDPAELEESISSTRNSHAWIRMETPWTATLESDTVISLGDLDNRRSAEVNDPEQLVAQLSDVRNVKSLGIEQHWQWSVAADHRVRLGFNYQHQRAEYDYRALAGYFGFYADWPDIANPYALSIQATPDGDSYGIYLADRWQATKRSALELGLRWDRQTYVGPGESGQLSPRVSLLHDLTPDSQMRFTWGRYYQSQAIQRLQVEDGIEQFHPPERAEHWIAGFRQRMNGGYRFRLEAFLKRYDRLSPRYENLFDALALIPELEPDRVRLDPQSARAAGVELSVEYQGGEFLDWWVSYSLARVTDRIDGSDQPRSWDQRHALQAGASWERGPWEIGAALNWHSGWPTTGMTLGMDEEEEGEVEVYPVPGMRNAERLGDYRTLDFRVSRDIAVRRGELSAFFEVSNAGNRHNPCCVDFDIDEDEDGNVFLDRTVDDWLPLIPAFGLLWTF